MGELGVINSNSAEGERPRFGFGWNSSPPPDPTSFSEECLSSAEEAAQQVISCIHPTMDSEEKRRNVIDYVQTLIRNHLNCEVFPYGSVPLKTYLPDGDIDLTALKGPNSDDSLAHDVLALIQSEEQNEYAEYEVKDTQFIDAEVKLVKCLVRNIVVDISFNQLGGLSTLCFLEQVDRLVGRNHLFKRSIMLVKAWCYYESRILGAHHGLLSTYALETLVLYIFHLFPSSLNGPLEVLYKFLNYYSQFDWENYCISLNGPVCKSSLPDIVVKMPDGGLNNKMLSDEFLENCIEMFEVPLKELEGKPKVFQTKHLNIVDPLKENNNLGRSVHRGNFYRILSAFKHGARKLGQVLLEPKDKIANEISKFFSCTMARHGQQHMNYIRRWALEVNDEDSSTESFSSEAELFFEDGILMRSSISDFDRDSLCLEEKPLMYKNKEEKCWTREATLDLDFDVAISDSSLRNSSDHTSSISYSASISANNGHKTHDDFSKPPSAESGSLEMGNFHPTDVASHKFGFESWLENREKHGEMNNTTYGWCMNNSHGVCISGSDSPTPMVKTMENLSFDYCELELASTEGEESEAFNPLANLSGEYECHVRSLIYGQWCHGVLSSELAAHHNPDSLSLVADKTPWDIVHNSFPFTCNHFSQMNSLTVSMQFAEKNQTTFSMELRMGHATPDSNISSIILPSERKPKTRGTGTYIPNVNGFYKDRSMQGTGRKKAPANNHRPLHKHGQNNGFYFASCESNNNNNSLRNGTHRIPLARSKSEGRWRSDFRCESPRSVGDRNQINVHSNGSFKIEFGSVGNLAEEVISESVCDRSSNPPAPSLKTEVTRPAVMEKAREVGMLIHLKNEQEFPPLCQV